jgi:Protein of unknown function (DUF3592)
MFLLMGLCFGLSSFALLGGAVWTYFSQKRTAESRVTAAGIVVELVSRVTTSGRASMMCPVVEFTASSGEKIKFTSEFGSLPASHKIGQIVTVRYDPVEPQKAEIDSTMTRWSGPVVYIFMGVIACCLSVSFLGIYWLMSSVPVSP